MPPTHAFAGRAPLGRGDIVLHTLTPRVTTAAVQVGRATPCVDECARPLDRREATYRVVVAFEGLCVSAHARAAVAMS